MIKSHVLYQLSYEPLVRCFGHTKVLLFLKLANLEEEKSGAKGGRPVVEEGKDCYAAQSGTRIKVRIINHHGRHIAPSCGRKHTITSIEEGGIFVHRHQSKRKR